MIRERPVHGLKPGFAYTPGETLPHRPPMLLIDEVLDYETEAVRCLVRITRDSLYCGDDGVPAWVGLEYMAQAMGVYSGIELLQKGESPRIGLLLGTRRYESIVPAFAIGARLDVSARVTLWEEDNLYAFDCAILQDGRKLAWGEIKAFRPRDVHAYLKENT